jgi:hypothetical protein
MRVKRNSIGNFPQARREVRVTSHSSRKAVSVALAVFGALTSLALLPGLAAAYRTGAVRTARPDLGIRSFDPASGEVGATVTITGWAGSQLKGAFDFTGATAVTFNGTPAASFTVDSASQITATVASGTTSGPISVTTPAGTKTSKKSFGLLTRVYIFGCSHGGGGNANVPAGTYPYLRLAWDMADSSYLNQFLSSTSTTVAIDGKPVKKADSYWDPIGQADGGGGWITNWLYNTGILLAPGDTLSIEAHEFVTNTFSDGVSTYPAGIDLLSGGAGNCTIHALG